MAKKKNIRTYQRGNTWTYSFETARVGGKRKPVTKGGFATESDAYKAGMLALADYVNGVTAEKPVNISYGDFLEVWMPEMQKPYVNERTFVTNTSNVKRHIIPGLGNIKLEDLSARRIKSFYSDCIQNGLSKTTVRSIRSLVCKSLQSAVVDYGFLKSNPAREVSIRDLKSNKPKKERRAYTRKEQDILLKACRTQNEYVAILIGLHCGMRISEVFALTWDDINFKARTIDINKQIAHSGGRSYVTTPKCNSYRVISFDQKLEKELKKLQLTQKKEKLKVLGYPETLLYEDSRKDYEFKNFDFIFRTPTGSLWNKQHMTLFLQKVSKEHDIHFDFHSLRHTHSTELQAHHAPVEAVQERLGHKSLAVTLQVYTHNHEKMQEELRGIINNDLYANS